MVDSDSLVTCGCNRVVVGKVTGVIVIAKPELAGVP